MKYIILRSNKSKAKSKLEVENRREFLFDVFKLYFVYNQTQVDVNKITLESFPFGYSDYLFIKGENKDVYRFLNQNIKSIKQKNIVLITCGFYDYSKLVKNKNLYICKLDNNYARLYDGSEFGFEFDITLSEIKLYKNRHENIQDNIKMSFEKI